MNTITIKPINIIGIAVRTTNENGQSAADIPLLWNRFFTENIAARIPGKISEEVYSIYTDYELDYTKPYTTIIGCRVEQLTDIPEGLIGKVIGGGSYTTFVAKGKLSDQIVFTEWQKIWNTDLPRAYTSDFEIYGAGAQNPDQAEVEIFVGVKE
ncbi:GyrI-like domain-containing protein [Pedobacter frigoris]|uniref:GyrI-like domain-containing protein n=1 Tax=Pedobacter frigoris TaxID=2571272 RepID=UPI00292E37CD|nr:effector binding domain-containing protein [Pedobacter frigoris]